LQLDQSEGTIRSLAYSPDGAMLAATGSHRADPQPGVLCLWDARTGERRLLARVPRYPVPNLTMHVSHVAFSPDSRRVAMGVFAGNKDDVQSVIKVWDVVSGKEVRVTQPMPGMVLQPHFSRDGKLLLAASDRGLVQVWDAATGEVHWTFKGRGLVRFLASSPDNQRAAALFLDEPKKLTQDGPGELVLWNLDTGQVLLKLPVRNGVHSRVAFSPDSTRLAVLLNDARNADSRLPGEVRMWDLVNLKELYVLRGHQGSLANLAFSHDGKRLATASAKVTDNGQVKLWDVATGHELLSLSNEAPADYLLFAPDDTRLVAATGTRIVSASYLAVVWDATPR
jgi:WD40 repeat protein